MFNTYQFYILIYIYNLYFIYICIEIKTYLLKSNFIFTYIIGLFQMQKSNMYILHWSWKVVHFNTVSSTKLRMFSEGHS